MPVVYFKRYRMQIDLSAIDLELTHENGHVRYIPWTDKTLGHHATAKWESFRFEMDAIVFPCLGERDGCRQLMRDLSNRNNFVPEATWLAISLDGAIESPVGTIQGLRTEPLLGAIQNVGVVPSLRGRGIGRNLILRSLHGFRDIGCRYVNLEVTIHNLGAIHLYESIGFRYRETVFKVGNVPISK